MIADTTFVSDLLQEFRSGKTGPARAFFARNRTKQIRTTIISAAELAVLFPTSGEAWKWLAGKSISFIWEWPGTRPILTVN
jgi:hypothetical protein